LLVSANASSAGKLPILDPIESWTQFLIRIGNVIHTGAEGYLVEESAETSPLLPLAISVGLLDVSEKFVVAFLGLSVGL
jgi:hypothetical protein